MKKRYLFLSVFMFILLVIDSGCLERANTIKVIPGKSIDKVELGMTEEQVIEILGKPSQSVIVDLSNLDLRTGEEKLLTDEELKLFDRRPSKMLVFLKPRLDIIIDKYGRVRMIRLLDMAYISIVGYPSLKDRNLRKYFSLDEIESVGKPSSFFRNKLAESELSIPTKTVVECYEYWFEEGSLRIGLYFDKTIEKKSKYYIAIFHITVCERTP